MRIIKYKDGSTKEFESLVGADIRDANMCGADMRNAIMRNAIMRNAIMHGAIMCNADMCGADMRNADMRNADMCGADLRNAAMHGTAMRGADLRGAKVAGVKWPPPTMVLLARWGKLSHDLTIEAMYYDAANHPDPTKFDTWITTGECPYDGCSVQRACNFAERKDLWPGWNPDRKVLSSYELMMCILKEKCVCE